MLKKIFCMSILLMFLTPGLLLAHGDEKHKEKPEKVSAMMHEEEHTQGDSLAEAKEKEVMEKDFAEIREDVEKSAVPTVIKAASLAVFIAGLAFLYLPRKKKEDSNV